MPITVITDKHPTSKSFTVFGHHDISKVEMFHQIKLKIGNATKDSAEQMLVKCRAVKDMLERAGIRTYANRDIDEAGPVYTAYSSDSGLVSAQYVIPCQPVSALKVLEALGFSEDHINQITNKPHAAQER